MCEYNNTGRDGMSFYRKYELERLVQKTEPKTFRAHEVSGGRAVYLHMLGGMDAATRARLLQRVHGLMSAGNPAILDIDDSEFAPYVGTGVIERFDGLLAWLDNLPVMPGQVPAAKPAALPMQPASAAAPPTETFHQRPAPASSMPPPVPPRAPAPPIARSAPPPAPVAPPAASSMPPASEPGEFTRMFAGTGANPAAAPAAPPAQPAASPRPPAASPVKPSPAPVAPPPASPVMPPVAASGGSEFSKLFGASPLSSAPPAAEEPGEFSRIFGAPPPMPSDNPAGFAPPPAARPRAPEAPLPWEPQPAAPSQPPPLPPQAAAPQVAASPAPPQMAAPQRPRVETPDTQRPRQCGMRPRPCRHNRTVPATAGPASSRVSSTLRWPPARFPLKRSSRAACPKRGRPQTSRSKVQANSHGGLGDPATRPINQDRRRRPLSRLLCSSTTPSSAEPPGCSKCQTSRIPLLARQRQRGPASIPESWRLRESTSR